MAIRITFRVFRERYQKDAHKMVYDGKVVATIAMSDNGWYWYTTDSGIGLPSVNSLWFEDKTQRTFVNLKDAKAACKAHFLKELSRTEGEKISEQEQKQKQQ